MSTGPSALRQDIQLLRGVAVLAVLVYHSGLVHLPGGYLGVDMFFVISGYLITGNILNEVDRQRFSFRKFYARRVRRLLPAAYCTLVMTALLAATVLTRDRWADFVAQFVGALTFTANIVLPLQTGYFEAGAETKPLLHMWSLSVEEQYYFFAPLLLVLLRPRWRRPVLVLLALLSGTLCWYLVSSQLNHWRVPQLDSRQFAFFMLPTRAWELTAGALLACAGGWPAARWLNPAVKGFLLLLLLVIFVHPFDTVHPRGDALAAVAITVLLIAGPSNWIGRRMPVRALCKVGDWSYSLYLVHWPLFSLAHSAYLGQVPTAVRAALVVLSLLLAWLQFEKVEQRFRHDGSGGGIGMVRMASLSLAMAALPFVIGAVRPGPAADAHAYLHQSNRGLSAPCAAGGAITNPRACSTSDRPRIAVWGDSYAMHLMPGLRSLAATGDSLLQVTKTACAPIRDVVSIDANYDESWARGCAAFNEQAFQLIAGSESVRYVVMSSPFAGYLDAGELKLLHRGASISGQRQLVIDAFERTVRELQSRGKHPILVAPPPRPGFDAGACHEQHSSSLVVLGRRDCSFSAADAARGQAGIIDGLRQVADRTQVPLIWLDGAICRAGTCQVTNDEGFSIYKDNGHLSIPGSTWVLRRTELEAALAGM